MSLPELDDFLSWFQQNGGTIDLTAVGFKMFPPADGGRGAIALKNFKEGETLFTIPRSLTLSTKTSLLPQEFGLKAWKDSKLDQGWSGLILCMMWESAKGSDSKWYPYLATLPNSFDTPMFWDEDDLKELEGTSVVEKLGKADAEKDYHDKVLCAIQTRPDLFLPSLIPVHYTLAHYHLMGSRILSRSFDVERPEGGDGDGEETHRDGEAEPGVSQEADTSMNSMTSAMDVDVPAATQDKAGGEDEVGEEDHEEDGEEEEEEEDPIDVSMVPMADLLNARYGTENAKLFYDQTQLKMVATKRIRNGEQIWNTYGDLPNSELLRRHGHVDLLPLVAVSEEEEGSGLLGNPGDVVEIKADLVLSAVAQGDGGDGDGDGDGDGEDEKMQGATLPLPLPISYPLERIDWWLEQGGDDVFVLDTDYDIPESLISLVRLLLLPAQEWDKAREKEKARPPKPKMDTQTLGVVVGVLERRIGMYPSTTGTEDDERLLKTKTKTKSESETPPGSLSLTKNKYLATIVRLGEKRILRGALEGVKRELERKRERERGKVRESRNGDLNDKKRKSASSASDGQGNSKSKKKGRR